ncbi:hypothetical protein SISSUDRAFT_981682 [Sistotremastrum suecicum HHB10207 ss-3]|uniref:Mei2-like C-terminal RNA recognition motif domain-containing protein n=1 Tax=Sistotremastrum suecicum HHB10207 ss-3 TaxID=1314776 RepID=A0A166GB51_9AGAM|nr:hypothetical protein SISSUDRAFT_981682 [Sistotremastrum suecicum HHB10207 ss-3]
MREVGVAHPSATPLRNVLDFEKIEAGQDTRTTVMIKNIPNKMTDKDLLTYIHAICPRKIDFMYLRIDFNNHCNVGYAFVNFIEVSDLLLFAKTKLGTRWNMFSSEKVLQMSYANYQGKEALIEKFKNSCIMGEREGWRPKIFYSHGKKQGLPEPFPEPTNAKRVERAQQTRGPLWASQQGNLSPARDSALWTKMRNPNQQNRSLSPKGQNREHNPIHRRLANNS